MELNEMGFVLLVAGIFLVAMLLEKGHKETHKDD